VLFFIALHDLGKLDMRFQWKVSEIATRQWPELAEAGMPSCHYDHGQAGYAWAVQEWDSWLDVEWNGDRWDAWRPGSPQ
jgi:CRISPR-associated endonuclease/helicase Cas3